MGWGWPWCGYRSPRTEPSLLAARNTHHSRNQRKQNKQLAVLVRPWKPYGSYSRRVAEARKRTQYPAEVGWPWGLSYPCCKGLENWTVKGAIIGGWSRVALGAAWEQLPLGFPSPTDAQHCNPHPLMPPSTPHCANALHVLLQSVWR